MNGKERWRRPATRFALAALVVAAWACSEDRPSTNAARRAKIDEMYAGYRESFPGVPALSPDEFRALREEKDVVLVDTREPEETGVSMLPGALTKEQFEQNMDAYRDRTVVTYCTIGYRSGLYAKRLKEKGLRARNLKGSILAWVHAGGKVVDEKGETRRVHVYGPKWNLLPDGYEPVW
jgi:sodium/bile acid cotransporter 7